jgi:biopolymer transport protein ExbB
MEYMSAGGVIMWIILFISVIAMALIIERIIFIVTASADPGPIEADFARALASGGPGRERFELRGRSSMHNVFRAAWEDWRRDSESLKELLEQRIRRELYRWEKNLSFLEIAAKISPLLGLLGTVLGMVEMFRMMNVGGAVNSAAVTGGIWKALFTTVAGLAVAIPVIVLHGVLVRRMEFEEEKLRRGVDFLMRKHLETNEGSRT